MNIIKTDIVAVGTGFSTTFWLKKYLQKNPQLSALILEKGAHLDDEWRMKNKSNMDTAISDHIENIGHKTWDFTIAQGGGSNCWAGCTPRFLPSDFALNSKYGISEISDWPLDYEDLLPYYEEAEMIMNISGPDRAFWPMNKSYPQPAHLMSDVDQMMKNKWPEHWFVQPTARARTATDHRAACCSSGVCALCPVNAKFMLRHDLPEFWSSSQIRVQNNAFVTDIVTKAGVVTGVKYSNNDQEFEVQADIVLLGANAIFNAWLLKKSGLGGDIVGKGITEQVAVPVFAHTDGVKNFNGSTRIPSNGYMLYERENRGEMAGAIIESHNTPVFRQEPGKWRDILTFKVVFDDLPQDKNYVDISSSHPDKPQVTFQGHSPYTLRAIERIKTDMENILSGLPVNNIFVGEPYNTESHIMCSHPMSKNESNGVVNKGQKVHGHQNLFALGAGSFINPTPSNPTLTLSALSLYSANNA